MFISYECFTKSGKHTCQQYQQSQVLTDNLDSEVGLVPARRRDVNRRRFVGREVFEVLPHHLQPSGRVHLSYFYLPRRAWRHRRGRSSQWCPSLLAPSRGEPAERTDMGTTGAHLASQVIHSSPTHLPRQTLKRNTANGPISNSLP